MEASDPVMPYTDWSPINESLELSMSECPAVCTEAAPLPLTIKLPWTIHQGRVRWTVFCTGGTIKVYFCHIIMVQGDHLRCDNPITHRVVCWIE